jgi:predicted CoA-substrate-specific enzyme activase
LSNWPSDRGENVKPQNGEEHGSDHPREGGGYTGSLYCGVDVGASATKVVLVDGEGGVRGKSVLRSGVDYQASARVCFEEALAGIPVSEGSVIRSVGTGYGRRNVEFAQETVTEITCHGRGCYDCFPRSIVIVDIGGQDSKVIKLDADGRRVDFKMNRKCAAGTGAFLEEIAARLDIPLSDLDQLARGADKEFTLGSFCTVFTKTEILAYLRKGERVENIIRGAFHSVVHRIIEMDRLEGQVVLTGGVVGYNPYLKKALGEVLGREVLVPPDPQFTGALGAALIAREEQETKN